MRKNTEPLFLVNLRTVVLSEANRPTRIPIAMTGTFHRGKQKFSISRADVATMAANFAKRGNGEVVIDYEHASEQPEVAGGGPVPAAGWIRAIDPDPDADRVVWGEVQFTSRARDMIAAGEYRYGSPALDWGARDKRTGDSQGLTLTSFALTNTPVLDRMPAIRLSDAFRKEDEGEETNMADRYLVSDVKRMFGENGLKGLDPRIELEQVAAKLTERAEKIAKEKSVPFSEGYKEAAREAPELIRRYRVLTDKARGHSGDED